MSKNLVVFNICGINGHNNLSSYKKNLHSIVSQSTANHTFDIAVSACLNSPTERKELMAEFDLVGYNDIKDKLPVNVTFNHTCRLFSDYDAYVYVDSGISFADTQTLETMFEAAKPENIGLVSCNSTTDCGLESWFPEGYPKTPFFIPPGKCHNNHVLLFSRKILDYYGNLLPDIFASHCTESVQSFVVAALRLNWLCLVDLVVEHDQAMDGSSAGFPCAHLWNHTFASRRSIAQIVHDQKAYESGLGYEEGHGILLHDASQFDSRYHCINEDLKVYIRDNLYLQPEDFDYSNINSKLYI